MTISAATDEGKRLVEFRNTLYVPDLRSNLISVAKIADQGHSILFRKDDTVIANSNGEIKMIADRRGDLYYIREAADYALTAVQIKDLEMWRRHERF